MICDEVRQVAPEAALELLDGAGRAEVLSHVAACTACRTELAELAGVADALLLVAPAAEPPSGFEGRVMARLLADRSVVVRRVVPRWAMVAAAAAVLALGIVGASALQRGDRERPSMVAASLIGTNGQRVGEVVISPDRMTCVLDRAPEGARYAVSVTADDAVADIGIFTSRGPGWAWDTELPVDGRDIRRVVIRDADGSLRASADIPS